MLKGLGSAAMWSALQTGVRVACSFLSIKVTAVFLGPAGLALTGQLGNFISLLQSLLGNAPNTALVNLSVQARERDPARAAAAIGTSMRVSLALGLLAAVVLLVAQRPLAAWLFRDADYAPLIMLLALAVPAILMGQMRLSLFSSRRRFDLVARTNVAATIVGSIVFVSLCALFGLKGGLIGTLLAYPMAFFAGLWLGRQGPGLFAHWGDARRTLVPEVARFYPMLLLNSISIPLAMLLVRDTLMRSLGPEQAGLWQSAQRLSDMYTQLVIATLSMYSLPTLSGARDPHEFRTLLARLVGLCLVVGIAAAGVLFLMRRPLIHLVFTPAFAAVADLWPWQLIGDVFLLAGWPLRSALTAQRRMLPYMVVEAGLGLGLVAVTHAFVSRHGAAAGNMAYAVVFGTAFAVLLLLHLPTWRPQPAGALARSG